MFAQANSEHCRHKIFNADWIVDGARQPQSLFAMIRHTHAANPQGTVLAYADNAAIIEGRVARRASSPTPTASTRRTSELTHIVIKCETHNHPTAISPFPGRGDRLGRRDPRRGRDRARRQAQGGPGRLLGLAPAHPRARAALGERRPGQARRASPRRSTSCSTGRSAPRRSTTSSAGPNLCGYFRTFEQRWRRRARLPQADHARRRPRQHRARAHVAEGAVAARQRCSIQLGGPGMLIGMGGGAASSMGAGANVEDLDFDSVQRDNAEIQRRAQEVIDRCWQLGAAQPDPLDPRRRRRRAVQRAARARARRRARRAPRAARDPDRGQRHVAARDLVQRGAGALRARDRARGPGSVSSASASASAARSRCSAPRPPTAGCVVDDPQLRQRPVDIDAAT